MGRGFWGISHCWDFGFFVLLEGCHLFHGGGEFGVINSAQGFPWERICMGYSYVGLGSLKLWEVAVGDRLAGEASLWGLDVF